MTTRTFTWEGRCYDGTTKEDLLNFYLLSDSLQDINNITKGIKRLSWTGSFKIEDVGTHEEFAHATLVVPQHQKGDVKELLIAMKFMET